MVGQNRAMTAEEGRREASKKATAAALRDAAARLFAERGYDATTVRDVASAAGVTERTFYRYFGGKEGLVADEYLAWLATLRMAIEDRPASEPPLTAVRNAVLSMARRAPGGERARLWLFIDRPSMSGLRQSAPRPLLRLEASIAEAVRTRLRLAARADHGAAAADLDDLAASVIARTAVAVLRSAIIRHRQLRAEGNGASADIRQLLEQAFDVIFHEVRRESQPDG
jgi:AcrR family transcriptional regulator